jgi:alkylated DNA repair protein alkB family protein 8
VRGFPCDCDYPEHCNSQQAPLPLTRLALLKQAQQAERADQAAAQHHGCAAAGNDKLSAAAERGDGELSPSSPNPTHARLCPPAEASLQHLEDLHVNAVYNAIAPHFSATRFAVWPKVRQFVESLPSAALVADVGCGNGKYFGLRRDIYVLGSDRSQGLAGVAARRLARRPSTAPDASPLRADVAVADAMALPYRPGICDAVLCIAVLHHISSAERRLRLLGQLARSLRPGESVCMRVWGWGEARVAGRMFG